MRPLPILLLVALLAGIPSASAQGDPVEVDVGVLVLNMGNYDVNKGTYLLDFYLFLKWDPAEAPANFTPEKLEFMNGRASAKDKIFDATDAEGRREVWYRIQANLYSEPHFDKFPFDTQNLEIQFEDPVFTSADLVYVPMQDESGIDEGFVAAGWRVADPAFEVVEKEYRFGETYSRGKFTITLSREPFSTAIKTMLPPIAFMLVSGISFFLHPTKWANRLGLGTSMIISAVMFHISQTLPLPPIARLMFFDKVMLAVYAFLVCSLLVTALIAIDEDYWKGSDHTKQINAYGAIVTVFTPIVVLAVLLATT